MELFFSWYLINSTQYSLRTSPPAAPHTSFLSNQINKHARVTDDLFGIRNSQIIENTEKTMQKEVQDKDKDNSPVATTHTQSHAILELLFAKSAS